MVFCKWIRVGLSRSVVAEIDTWSPPALPEEYLKARQEAVEDRPEFAPAATGPIERRSDNETKSK